MSLMGRGRGKGRAVGGRDCWILDRGTRGTNASRKGIDDYGWLNRI